MNGETGFLHSVGVWSVPICRSVEDPSPTKAYIAQPFHQLVANGLRISCSYDAINSSGKWQRSEQRR
jgi:hypothetical protein